jgi:tyrosine-protein kinase Etk/Wzc
MDASTAQAAGAERPFTVFDRDELDLRDLLDTLLEARWLVGGVAVAVLVLGAIYASLTTPIYRADALIQVEKKASTIPGLDDLSRALTGSDALSIAEIEILRSRSVISRVVQDLGLDISAEPRRFPLLGAALARRHAPGQPAGAWFGLRRYAWGGERIVVGRLAVPAELEGEPLTVVAGDAGRYRLLAANDQPLVEGEVGKAAKAETPAGAVEIFVREMAANPGTHFIVVKRPTDVVVQGLQERLRVSERTRQSGILVVSLEGASRRQVTDIVNGVVNSYLRQNVERRSEEASRMLAFLDQQLPDLKEQLDTAESALREYKAGREAPVDISVQGQELLNRTTDIERQISELELQRSELRQRFTEQHPSMVALSQKLGQLRQERGVIEQQFKGLPDSELQSVRLLRSVSVANELYVQLLNKAQELKVARAGTVGNARVVDAAVLPRKPVRPTKPQVLLLSLVLGVVLGAAAAFARKSLIRTLDNPERIEADLGLSVYATIPHSDTEVSLSRSRRKSGVDAEARLLCRSAAQEPAVESLRSLRTSLQFAMLQSRNNVVAIHGPTPAIGKSFVSSNLAFLLADIGKRVLLIDADMRKGHLHEALGVGRKPGFSDVIAGQLSLDEARHTFADGKVGLLTTGTLPPNPSELLTHANCAATIDAASRQYDVVILDTPPTLNLADCMLIGKLSGVNFMVVRGGQNTLKDLEIASKRLHQNGIRVDGVIFNDLSAATSRYRYGGYYAYQYKPQGGNSA